MVMTLECKGFEPLNEFELIEVDGGFLGTVIFTFYGIKVTVGMCMAAGAAIGLAAGGAVALKN